MKFGSESGDCIKDSQHRPSMKNHFGLLISLSFFILYAFVSCGKSKTEMVGVSFDPETSPVIHSENVSTLVSDSGITRYRLVAKVWDMYTKAKEPYWHFPEKMYVEKFDTLFNVDGSIEADTAYYYENKKLWKLIGNVKVLNLEGETFETSLLFWNQTNATVYTDSFVRVQRANEEITGFGFRSNQEMSNFSFYQSGVLLNVKEEEATPNVSTADSIPPL